MPPTRRALVALALAAAAWACGEHPTGPTPMPAPEAPPPAPEACRCDAVYGAATEPHGRTCRDVSGAVVDGVAWQRVVCAEPEPEPEPEAPACSCNLTGVPRCTNGDGLEVDTGTWQAEHCEPDDDPEPPATSASLRCGPSPHQAGTYDCKREPHDPTLSWLVESGVRRWTLYPGQTEHVSSTGRIHATPSGSTLAITPTSSMRADGCVVRSASLTAYTC
ncbi:MAG: hypothetical protein OXF93_04080 [Acidobacteria bacterium]|nr:hypothetical protein [Acidobacteriota bacterium]